MALIKDFEIPGTGVTVTGAYHVIINVRVDKTIQPAGVDPEGNEIPVVPYYGDVILSVYKDKAAREAFAVPLARIEGGPGMFHGQLQTRFEVDPSSAKSFIEQGYDHLLTQAFYDGATVD